MDHRLRNTDTVSDFFQQQRPKDEATWRVRIVQKIMFTWHFRYISTYSEYKGLETALLFYLAIVPMNLQQSQLSECICQNFMPSRGLSLSLWDWQVQTRDSYEHSDSSISRARVRIRLRIRSGIFQHCSCPFLEDFLLLLTDQRNDAQRGIFLAIFLIIHFLKVRNSEGCYCAACIGNV